MILKFVIFDKKLWAAKVKKVYKVVKYKINPWLDTLQKNNIILKINLSWSIKSMYSEDEHVKIVTMFTIIIFVYIYNMKKCVKNCIYTCKI